MRAPSRSSCWSPLRDAAGLPLCLTRLPVFVRNVAAIGPLQCFSQRMQSACFSRVTPRDVLHNSLRSVMARTRAIRCVAFLTNSTAIGCKKTPCGLSRSAPSQPREGYAGHPRQVKGECVLAPGYQHCQPQSMAGFTREWGGGPSARPSDPNAATSVSNRCGRAMRGFAKEPYGASSVLPADET